MRRPDSRRQHGRRPAHVVSALLGGVGAALVLVTPLTRAEPQTRDVPRLASGTATLAGSVTAREPTSEPLRRAVVTVRGPELGRDRVVVTDDDGRFVLERLPAARVSVVASKHGFVTAELGATGLHQAGTPVQLTAGRTTDVAITLPRTAVASGRITDLEGRPMEGVRVFALEAANAVAEMVPQRRANPTPTALTDDRGLYRLFDLAPDTYLIAALPAFGTSGRALTAPTPEQVDRVLAALRRGDGTVESAEGDAAGTGSPVGVVPVLFPGTSRRSQATDIVLGPGEERGGIDFAVAPVPVVSVEGVVVSPGPLPPSIDLNLVSPDLVAGTIGGAATRPVVAERPGATDRFRFTNVAPGSYTLYVRAADTPPVTGRAASAGASPGETLYGVTPLEVHGENVAGVTVVLQPGIRVRGRLSVDAGGGTAAPGDFRVTIRPPTGQVSWIVGGSIRGTTPDSDGTFDLGPVAPGRFTLDARAEGSTTVIWWPLSAMASGRDLLDRGVEVALGDAEVVVDLTMTDRLSALTGRLETASGVPAEAYTVLVFPADRTLWPTAARRLRSTRPATDGRYEINALAPGDYRVAVVSGGLPADWPTPAFLESLIPASVGATITLGQTTSRDLRMGRD